LSDSSVYLIHLPPEERGIVRGDKRATCRRCGYGWKLRHRVPGLGILTCPRCHQNENRPVMSKVDMIPRCPYCNHRWKARVQAPVKCPKCFRPLPLEM
jgi:predicted Zn-ribbon and HTH transcriptional regulator